jgi:hypothetical protein
MPRDTAMAEIERRLWTITTTNGYPVTVVSVVRNPELPMTRFPCVNVFEMDDEITTRLIGGGRGWYLRDLEVIIEFWREITVDGRGAIDAKEMKNAVMHALFDDGDDLGGACEAFLEKSMSRVMHPPLGKPVVGMALTATLQYTDERTYTKS